MHPLARKYPGTTMRVQYFRVAVLAKPAAEEQRATRVEQRARAKKMENAKGY